MTYIHLASPDNAHYEHASHAHPPSQVMAMHDFMCRHVSLFFNLLFMNERTIETIYKREFDCLLALLPSTLP